jgi:hypothetical protein
LGATRSLRRSNKKEAANRKRPLRFSQEVPPRPQRENPILHRFCVLVRRGRHGQSRFRRTVAEWCLTRLLFALMKSIVSGDAFLIHVLRPVLCPFLRIRPGPRWHCRGVGSPGDCWACGRHLSRSEAKENHERSASASLKVKRDGQSQAGRQGVIEETAVQAASISAASMCETPQARHSKT